MTSASLRLRGRHGPLRAELTWPTGEPAAVLVFIDDGDGEAACRELGDSLNAVTLRVACATHHDARLAVEWAEAHANELGVAAGQVIVIDPG